MTSLALIGGTGYTGTNIAAEAVRRGFAVTSLSRSLPTQPLDGVTYVTGSIDDVALVTKLAAEHDVLLVAIHAVDAENRPVLLPVLPVLVAAAVTGGARLAFVGGAGSSLVAPGGPRLFDTEGFPEQFKPEAVGHAEVLDWLRGPEAPSTLEWVYVSPAAEYGGYNPGEATGSYRTGDDVLVTDAAGRSNISGADFALAFVDELETPKHRNARFTVGY